MSETRILFKEQTISTMDDARIAVRAGEGHGTVCLAGAQSAGRGRVAGRRWEDDGESLLFTLILDRSSVRQSHPLTQILALSLCRRLESGYGLKPRIKWPNDVLLDGKKIAGILVETTGTYYLAGIGLNLIQENFSPDLRRPATSLSLALGNKAGKEVFPPEEELYSLLDEIYSALENPAQSGEFTDRLQGVGRRVSVLMGDPSRNELVTGILEGLKSDGAMLIRRDDGSVTEVYSGELK